MNTERPEKKLDLETKVARMNAVAVVQRMKDMSLEIAALNDRIDQQAQLIAMLQNRFDTEQMLRQQIETRGSGPTT